MNPQNEFVEYGKSPLVEDIDLLMSKSLKRLLDKLAKKGCVDMVFTRFPYYTSKMQCKRLALQKREGNCVAFAYYMKSLLQKHKMKAYIVGSKPPPKFARNGYRTISHAAVVLPYATGFVLFDTAFYFNKAIVLDKRSNYESCCYFTNVYSQNQDKWCFRLIDNNTIAVNINDTDVHSYYELKELCNPYQSITLHTNAADRTVFRCEVDNRMVSKFYYKIDVLTNALTVNAKTQDSVYENLRSFENDRTLDKKKLKEWIGGLSLSHTQKRKMYTDIRNYVSHNYPFVG